MPVRHGVGNRSRRYTCVSGMCGLCFTQSDRNKIHTRGVEFDQVQVVLLAAYYHDVVEVCDWSLLAGYCIALLTLVLVDNCKVMW